MDVYNHSSYLFFDGGNPMRFSMRPCDEREKLKPVVEHGGATITSKSTRGTIRLVTPGTIVNTDNCVYSKWIWDCVEQNKKIPIDSYKVKQQVASDISDFEDNETSVPSKSEKKRSPKGMRKEYLPEHDLAIINYLYDNRRLDEMKARSMWQTMERANICKGRSWQSLKERFNKQIFENIDSYNLSKEKMDYFRRMKIKDNKKTALLTPSPSGSEVSLKRKQTRLYSADEDFKLIHYVLDEDEFQSIGGNLFWKKLEAKKIVNRTWQSTKERFLKHVLHNTKKYKIENKYKECLRRLLSYMCIEHDSSTDISDEIDEIEEEIESESPKIESKSPKIESKSPKIESKSPKIELRSAASKECNVEARNESESSDLELRMEETDESQAGDDIQNAPPLPATEKEILETSKSPEIGNSAPGKAEIGAEDTPKRDENENLVVINYVPDEFGVPRLQISLYEESSSKLQDQPDVDLDEILARCVKSFEEEESGVDEDEIETDGVCEEEFANTVKNLMRLALSERPTNAAIQSDEAIVKDDDYSGKRKRSTPTEADLKCKRFSKCPRNPREKLVQKQLVKKAARVVELMNGRSKPSVQETEEIFKIAEQLERIGEQDLGEVDRNIKTLSVLFSMTENQTWQLLELYDFDRKLLFEEIGYKFP